MAKNFLYGPQVSAMILHVRGARVAQHVRVNMRDAGAAGAESQ
jgi:hypothetical protein